MPPHHEKVERPLLPLGMIGRDFEDLLCETCTTKLVDKAANTIPISKGSKIRREARGSFSLGRYDRPTPGKTCLSLMIPPFFVCLCFLSTRGTTMLSSVHFYLPTISTNHQVVQSQESIHITSTIPRLLCPSISASP